MSNTKNNPFTTTNTHKPMTSLQSTEEARRIVEQVLIKAARLNPADRELMVLGLKQVARELDLTALKIQSGKLPSEITELAGIPANMAFLTAMYLMSCDPEMEHRIAALLSFAKAAVKGSGKAA